jgi:hypothetical protein
MVISYTVQAKVVDINSDLPRQSDIFLLDTNILLWQTYPPATLSLSNPNRLAAISTYFDYISDAISVGATLCYSGLSLAELTHNIEKLEKKNSGCRDTLKEYRHNYPAERDKVVAEVQAAWGLVNNIAVPESITIDVTTMNRALQRFQTEKLDGYDLYIIETAQNIEGITGIITDDGDYVTAAGITVFTLNSDAIASALAQGKLGR